LIDANAIKTLPTRIPPAADEYLIRLFVSQWEAICLKSFEKVENKLKHRVTELCRLHFGRFRGSKLALNVKFVP